MKAVKDYILILFLPSFFLMLVRAIAEPVLPLSLEAAGISFLAIGTILSASPFGTLLIALPSGALLSRFSIRSVLLGGALLTSISVSLIYFAPGTPLLFALWMSSGIGLGLFELGRLQYTSAYIPNQERGRVISTIGGLFRAVRIIGPLIGGWLLEITDFQIPFLVMGAFGAMAALSVWLFVPETPPEVNPDNRSYGAELWQTVKDNRRIFSVAGTAQLLLQCVRTGRGTLIPLFGVSILGLSPGEISLLLALGAGLDTPLFFVSGILMDRYGRKAAIVPSAIIQSIGFVLIPFSTGFTGLAIASAVIGLGNSISAGTMMTLGGDFAPPGKRAPFLSVWRTFSSAGFVVGPNVVGIIAQLFALGPSSWAIAGIGGMAALLFWRYVPETLQKAPPTSVKG